MVFKLFKNFAASHHDIWIFCWLHRPCKYYSLLSKCRSYQTPFDEGISFVPSYRFSLSTRSQRRIQMLIAQFCCSCLIMLNFILCELFLPDNVLHRRRGSAHRKTVVSFRQMSSSTQSPFVSSLDGDFPLCCHNVCFMIFVMQHTGVRLRLLMFSVLAFSRRFHRKQLQVNSAHSSLPMP